MFNKTSKTSPQPASLPPMMPAGEPPRGAPRVGAISAKVASIIASDLTFEGDVKMAGELQLDGALRGDIKAQRLTIGETGNVEGNVEADIVEVRGRVVGCISGRQIKLYSSAYVEGDVVHEQLSIDVGAYFQGRCLQNRKVEPVAAPAPIPTVTPAPALSPTLSSPIEATPAASPPSYSPADEGLEIKPAV